MFTKDLIDEILQRVDKVEQRIRLLPSRVMLYYTIAMAMFPQDSYEEVMLHLVEGLSWWRVPINWSKVYVSDASEIGD